MSGESLEIYKPDIIGAQKKLSVAYAIVKSLTELADWKKYGLLGSRKMAAYETSDMCLRMSVHEYNEEKSKGKRCDTNFACKSPPLSMSFVFVERLTNRDRPKLREEQETVLPQGIFCFAAAPTSTTRSRQEVQESITGSYRVLAQVISQPT